jgi:hypothetical protein
MTEQEVICMDLTRDLWSSFLKLPPEHPSDQTDVAYHIHALQNIILSRSGLREYRSNRPGDFEKRKETK